MLRAPSQDWHNPLALADTGRAPGREVSRSDRYEVGGGGIVVGGHPCTKTHELPAEAGITQENYAEMTAGVSVGRPPLRTDTHELPVKLA